MTHHRHITALLFIFLLCSASAVIAGGVYQEPDEFISEAFDGDPPKPAVIWPDKTLKSQMADILGHRYKGLRIRYWKRDSRTAWILEEIGKEKPITTGFIIDDDRISLVRILLFRESRGWEVRHDFFTDQFKQASLTDDHQLSTNIDNVSGATLSVRAVTKLGRIALLLDRIVDEKEASRAAG